jgi:hypothetical protein
MWTYIFIAIGVALVTSLFLYLDSRLFDRPKKKVIYIKCISMNVAIALALVYLLTWLSPTSNIKDLVQAGGQNTKISGPSVMISQIGEEMLAGDAPF